MARPVPVLLLGRRMDKLLGGLKETLEACQDFLKLEGTGVARRFARSRKQTRQELIELLGFALATLGKVKGKN